MIRRSGPQVELRLTAAAPVETVVVASEPVEAGDAA
jgi:hypothetical protein